jgi:hypothetical protein
MIGGATAAEQYSGLHDMSPSFSRQEVIVVMKLNDRFSRFNRS